MGANRESAGLTQALVFLLGGGRFGIDILQVQEIRGNDRPAPIPAAPPFFRGVTNLRGQFVPVIDLRVKLGAEPAPASDDGVTIIVVVEGRHVGLVVDAVSEVIDIAPDDVRPAPFARYAASAVYIRGLLQRDDATIVLLDVARLLDASELKLDELMATAADREPQSK